MARPTIADLARAAGVSVSTVDRVLNARDPVRRATSERVLAAAERIGFHGTGAIRHRLGADAPERRLAFVLQQRSVAFYALLGDALSEATRAARGRPRVSHLEDLAPEAVAGRLLEAGEAADAVALVAADHPRVTGAIDQLHGRGVPVFALVSDLSAPNRAGYVGLDNWKVGRTAAWAVANLRRRPGNVAIFVGSHRYRCQEACEMGARSYFREHSPDLHLLEPRTSLEDDRYAHESTLDLLNHDPDLVGLFVAGGGIGGVMRALRDEGAAERIVTVGLDLTDETRSGLIDGTVALILSHPFRSLAEATVGAMLRAVEDGRPDPPRQILLPFDVCTPENV